MEDMKESHGSGEEGGSGHGSGNNGLGGGLRGGSNGGGGPGGVGPGGNLHYTIPGILHFLQHEWSRFEMDRSQWDVEKAELQARIAFLQGERKGQENLKNDLVRRIKMLEYALKQERAKYAKLKYGSEGVAHLDDGSKALGDDEELPPVDGDNYIAVSNVNWRQGRQLLRQYLQEIGYTDTIIDVRSNRVRSLLGLNDANNVNEENRANLALNGGESHRTRPDGTGAHHPAHSVRKGVTTLAEEMMLDTEASVLANFDFLSSEAEVDDDDEMNDDIDDGYNPQEMKLKASKLAQAVTEAEDKETEDVMNEFNFLTNTDNVDSIKSAGGGGGGGGGGGQAGGPSSKDVPKDLDLEVDEFERITGLYSKLNKKHRQGGEKQQQQQQQQQQREVELGNNLELGELEQLTIANDNESSYDISAPKEAYRKTWSAKYTLRSHFDGVRALGFHPLEPVLITASEDQTLKLWNLQKTIPAKKSASLDVEPVYTFRAHQGPVLSLAISPAGDYIFSGGLDTTIRCWQMPSPNVDPYDSYDPSTLFTTLTGHEDAVWGLSYHLGRKQLLSCSADGTVKLWSPTAPSASNLVRTFGNATEDGGGATPTSVDWVQDDPTKIVTAYSNGSCVIHDIESGKLVIKLDTKSDSTSAVGSINKVVSHPILPVTITAHEDRHIRFFDNHTGQMTHSMVAHLDAVTSLSLDTNGLYLISGSHDCSVRLWNLESKSCVQEITAHRKKFDESIFDVAFHPSKPFIASAGADALAKVFV
ncbi:striatin-3-like isoform X2 [Tigriopus californicus]|uniref:striatin-3-like isoform X2 n=1 Tax=Tigriopus californicus TaxID=6832 RepID=UPI0027DA7449|nr:striatin-3-like isoform X2 [Tigriopus californicus]